MNWRLGVVGFPIEHSLSPRLHEAGLALAGLTGTSERVAISLEEFASLEGLLGERFDALSVTMPLKELAASLCSHLDGAATRTSMVNSLRWHEGLVHGANTDGEGFVDALGAAWGLAPAGLSVAVIGAGGAARGVVDALASHGASRVHVLGRSPERVAWLAERYDVVGVADAYDLVVNTTPVHGRDDQVLPGVTNETVAVDITYEPRRSPWLMAYEERGCRSANGLGMLAYQAARQMSWWWGVPMDGEALMEVIA
ncbi:MAG TPA: shikimate dehydrogenase [Acidimicrobiales bacterium]|nr:shikimate dehydrogenase [Acidimicrobiales bacterium]